MSAAKSEVIFSVEEAPEDGFVARALGHSIFTEADDLDALREAVRDAVRCHFDEGDRPTSITLRGSRTTPKSSAGSSARS
jgi:hypothetical protein